MIALHCLENPVGNELPNFINSIDIIFTKILIGIYCHNKIVNCQDEKMVIGNGKYVCVLICCTVTL